MLRASPAEETVTSILLPGRAKGGSVAAMKTAAMFRTCSDEVA